jgi:hypothetical protein
MFTVKKKSSNIKKALTSVDKGLWLDELVIFNLSWPNVRLGTTEHSIS